MDEAEEFGLNPLNSNRGTEGEQIIVNIKAIARPKQAIPA